MWPFSVVFQQKNAQKTLKITKICFFGHKCCSETFTITQFGINKLVPHVNTHIKYQKPGFNNFEDIQFWKFSKICDFILLWKLLINMKCNNLIPVSVGNNDPKRLDKAGYMAKISCGWVGRGGNANFPTWSFWMDQWTNGPTDQWTYGLTEQWTNRPMDWQTKPLIELRVRN